VDRHSLLGTVIALTLLVSARLASAQCESEVYVAEKAGNKVSKVNTTSWAVTPVVTSGLSGPEGVALDETNNRLYVTEPASGRLSWIDLSTGAVTTLCTAGLGAPTGVALAKAGGEIFVTDSTGGNLYQTFPFGCYVNTWATGLSGPAGVVIDPGRTTAYVAESMSGEVSAVSLSTGEVTPILTGLTRPYGLALDRVGGTLYVTDSDPASTNKKLLAVDLATRQPRLIYQIGNALEGVVVNEGESYAYIADATLGWFLKIRLSDGAQIGLPFLGLSDPRGVALRSSACAHGMATPSRPDPTPGSRIAACVDVDLTGSTYNLGSYGAMLRWDPAVLGYLRHFPGDPPFDTPVVNATDVSSGRLTFADASGVGASGRVPLLCAEFDVLGGITSRSPLDLDFTSLFEANTIQDLRELVPAVDNLVLVRNHDCTIGDIFIDQSINSGDALAVLSYEIGILPYYLLQAINLGCGDADGSGTTNSTDANLMLTWEVGLPVGGTFPIGRAGNRFFDSCPGNTGATSALSSALAISTTEGAVGTLVPVLTPSVEKPYRGQNLGLSVSVDTSASGQRLGSFGARLTWDPRALTFLSAEGGATPGFESPLMNKGNVSWGELRFAHASPEGGMGRVEVLRVQFRALRALPHLADTFRLEFTSLGAPGPLFENLLPGLSPTRFEGGASAP